jgi:hypothetical protein
MREGEESAMAEAQRFKRLYPRRQLHAPCQVSCLNQLITGKLLDVSFTGVAIVLPVAIELTEAASVELPEKIRLRVQPVYNQPVFSQQARDQYRIGFQVQFVERGQRAWTSLCHVVHW